MEKVMNIGGSNAMSCCPRGEEMPEAVGNL